MFKDQRYQSSRIYNFIKKPSWLNWALVFSVGRHKVLRPEKFLLVCSAAWKGMRLREILETKRIIDFYESDQTSSNYLKSFGLDLKGLKSRIFINNNEALIKAIVAGIGFGTLTEAVAKPFIEDGQLIVLNQAKALENKMALVWYPRPAKQKYFEDLIRSIK